MRARELQQAAFTKATTTRRYPSNMQRVLVLDPALSMMGHVEISEAVLLDLARMGDDLTARLV